MKYKNIELRPISPNDTENIVIWRSKKSVRSNLFGSQIITKEDHINWMKNYVEKGQCVQFIIKLADEQVDIGTVFIKNIDRNNLKGEFGIFIGEEEYRGKGYGASAIKIILDYAFIEMKLNKVYLSVLSENIAAIKSYEKVGFKKDGVLRQDYRSEDFFHDVVIMSVLNSEHLKVQ